MNKGDNILMYSLPNNFLCLRALKDSFPPLSEGSIFSGTNMDKIYIPRDIYFINIYHSRGIYPTVYPVARDHLFFFSAIY